MSDNVSPISRVFNIPGLDLGQDNNAAVNKKDYAGRFLGEGQRSSLIMRGILKGISKGAPKVNAPKVNAQ